MTRFGLLTTPSGRIITKDDTELTLSEVRRMGLLDKTEGFEMGEEEEVKEEMKGEEQFESLPVSEVELGAFEKLPKQAFEEQGEEEEITSEKQKPFDSFMSPMESIYTGKCMKITVQCSVLLN